MLAADLNGFDDGFAAEDAELEDDAPEDGAADDEELDEAPAESPLDELPAVEAAAVSLLGLHSFDPEAAVPLVFGFSRLSLR